MHVHSALGLIGVARMDLLKEDLLAHDVEPYSGITFKCGLVLPSLMGGTVSLHKTQLTT
ncbi:hypothetical protein ABIE18_002694 [Arthrobacter sp. 2762]